jgi:hypothetical protein
LHWQKEDDMNLNPFNFMIRKDEQKSDPQLANEFDPVYIELLAKNENANRTKGKRRSWLAAIGSWIIALGLRIKHGFHPGLAVRRVSVRAVSAHHYRMRHHK